MLVSGYQIAIRRVDSDGVWRVCGAFRAGDAATLPVMQSGQNHGHHQENPTWVQTTAPRHPNQFALLRQRRFAPFFWTQFSGRGQRQPVQVRLHGDGDLPAAGGWLPPAMAGLVIGALFILPFLLFSATSGQLADKYDKRC
jgi:hypothetical protein